MGEGGSEGGHCMPWGNLPSRPSTFSPLDLQVAKHATSSACCPPLLQVCNRVTGLLSPDPDGHVLAGALVYGSGRSDDFEDERRADSNRVGIENSAGLAAALAGVAQVCVCLCWLG